MIIGIASKNYLAHDCILQLTMSRENLIYISSIKNMLTLHQRTVYCISNCYFSNIYFQKKLFIRTTKINSLDKISGQSTRSYIFQYIKIFTYDILHTSNTYILPVQETEFMVLFDVWGGLGHFLKKLLISLMLPSSP